MEDALYVGVSSDLPGRNVKHKKHAYRNSFTAGYNLEWLVYYKHHSTIEEAMLREKQVKKWSRAKKDALTNTFNPARNDLTDTCWTNCTC